MGNVPELLKRHENNPLIPAQNRYTIPDSTKIQRIENKFF